MISIRLNIFKKLLMALNCLKLSYSFTCLYQAFKNCLSIKTVNILGIESSCDDTSASVLSNGKILTNYTAGQEIHKEYGGVVPELASRAHQKNVIPVIDKAIKDSGIKKEDLTAIAYTIGPGLLGSLLVGSSFAKGMAAALSIPLLEVNHMEAHIFAHLIENKTNEIFPFLNLTVSGGHTQLVIVNEDLSMEVIGRSLDDAAGEAFDKCGKLMELDYPAGPLVDKFAETGNAEKFTFPRSSMMGYDYSFSGLKTAFLYFLQDKLSQDQNFVRNNLNDLCASLQENIVIVLLTKMRKAARELKIKKFGDSWRCKRQLKTSCEISRNGRKRALELVHSKI